MRNYVIINGVNSLTIQGLAINNLPPITKPMIRTQREEIDGRDGDLITELGYSAYDKTMEIGLYGNFDIDAIIKYFTGEGTIVFSNEADKYYNFKILDQIDYEKLLKFKTAVVTFHCQPFKYPLEETPQEEQYEYVEATGTNLTLNNTEETIFNKFDLIGNTYQDTTTGKNLVRCVKTSPETINDVTFTPVFKNGELQYINVNGTASANTNFYITTDAFANNETLTAGTYVLSDGVSGESGTTYFTYMDSQLSDNYNLSTVATKTNTIPNETKIKLRIVVRNGANLNNVKFYPMVEKGSAATSYEPYTGGIPAPNPDFPEDIHVVSGDNEITICGKNLLDTSSPTTVKNQSGDDRQGYYCRISTTGTYTIILNTTNTMYYGKSNNINSATTLIGSTSPTYQTTYNFNSGEYFVIWGTKTDSDKMMVSNSATTYTPYTGSSYPISLGVKNEINESLYTTTGSAYVDSIIGGVVTSTSMTGYQGMRLDLGQDIVLPANTNVYIRFKLKSSAAGNVFNMVQVMDSTNASKVTTSITKPNPTTEYQGYYCSYNQSESFTLRRLYFQHVGSSSETFTVKDIMLSFTPSINYYPYSNVPIEMCSIEDNKDMFLHEDNKWYKLAKVGKMLLNGTENWQKTNDTVASVFTLDTSSIYPLAKYTQPGKGLSNYFILAYKNKDGSIYFSAQNRVVLVRDTSYTLETFKTWLSSHNTTVYYVLKNQAQTEITDTTLKSQLDDLWENATSYKGQTNITQTNNDMPFILDVSALELGSDHLIINNIGTAYSKPTIDIEGTGIVDIYLNDEQIFEIDMTNENEIIIDTEKMEAYTPDNTLANRLVTGDYSNFKLAPGNNDLRFSGDLTKATVTRYIRWI